MNLILLAGAVLLIIILIGSTYALNTLVKGNSAAAGIIWSGCVCAVLGLLALLGLEADLGDQRTGLGFIAAGVSLTLVSLGAAAERWS